MNKRVLIMTGASDIFRKNGIREGWGEDKSYYDVLDLTVPSKQRYAKKHNYDFLCLRSFGSDNKFGFKETQLGELRAIRAFENLEYYDVVAWIDADAIITNEDMSIEEFQIEEDVSFYASYDWMGKGSFSTGNFILQKTKYTQQFFDFFLQIAKQVDSEQTAFNAMYYQTNAKETMKVLECNFLNSFIAEIMETKSWATRNPISANCLWEEGNFLCHLGGIKNEERIDLLNTHFKKYI
jgi:hypothetical protein